MTATNMTTAMTTVAISPDPFIDILKIIGIMFIYIFYGWICIVFNRMYNDTISVKAVTTARQPKAATIRTKSACIKCTCEINKIPRLRSATHMVRR